MKKKRIYEFNVIEYDWNQKKPKPYNVLPYFRDVWRSRKTNFEKEKVHDKETLKEWIVKASQYMFWARCEFEFLIAPWPFGSYQLRQELKTIENTPIDYDKLINIIMQDMKKIDIHEQILMNIDIITDILYKEFRIRKKPVSTTNEQN